MKSSSENAYKWISYNHIPLNFKTSAIAAEDSAFLNHKGFNFKAIRAAYKYNREHHTSIGASTISQQTVKNVFLWSKKSFLRKGLEAYFTLLIESLWGKKRILEVYLNIIETGDNIYGINSAVQIYYQKSVYNVNDYEVAMLMTLLPNPKTYIENEFSLYRTRRALTILRLCKRVEKEKL